MAQLAGLGSKLPAQFHNGYRGYVRRPCAIAGTRTDQWAALGCALSLGAIVVLEMLTPNDVVGVLALLPLTAGAWLLSGQMAALIMGAGSLSLAAAVLLEPRNRVTLLLVAVSVLVTAAFVRLCATSVSAGWVADDKPSAALPLTRRELEVARLAALAYTAAEIGHQLHIGERTVESHIANTYVKPGIKSRSELIRIASRLN